MELQPILADGAKDVRESGSLQYTVQELRTLDKLSPLVRSGTQHRVIEHD